ncbi:carboxyl-terminal protease [Flavobacteriaceae bacterium F89]|uniref:Carboxyl-terminal protease n=1 Tax=Cerina litoralis TaxID=2874477 RepID=A0AAE3EW98_9FLAO|nr:S41 family peptidase [Cerina litoralis]MCG2460806.1 carboxyl-terminal protease [Cerina litoralis]
MKKYIGLILALSILISGCKKDEDTIIDSSVPENITVQNFMWKAMNIWYFWQQDVPVLADDHFSTNTEYIDYLKQFDDPKGFYEDQLQYSADRFSFLSEDYKTLVQSLAGITKSNGLEFGLVRFQGSDFVFGYVRYVVPNSNAATKDIGRGDIFTAVDGQKLDVNNYIDLLFGENDTYTLTMADISDGVATDNGKEVTLTKEEGLVENPIFLSKTFEINGKKIGYLVYNIFIPEYDEELNKVFEEFKSQGVSDLILDVRYNPGGDVNSSRLLSSMIYGTDTDKLYIHERWNDKIEAVFNPEDLNDYFANTTGKGTPINTLGLSKVYILTTKSTASASELVINCLAPYLDVEQIGTKTTGKNEFSLTLVDIPSNSYVYNPSKEEDINKNNSWGIQPLVGRNENADGFSDYTSGLVPDIELPEDLENLGVLGDQNEPLLARALQEITGVTAKRDFRAKTPVYLITSSKMFTPVRDNMYLANPKIPSLTTP